MSEKPPEPKPSEAADTDDNGPEPLPQNKPKLHVAGEQPPKYSLRPKATREQPLIRDDSDFDIVVDEAIHYLAKNARVYQRAKKLVTIDDGEISEVNAGMLRFLLSNSMKFRKQRIDAKTEKSKWVDQVANDRVIQTILARKSWGARELRGITRVPIVRGDGTILQTSGYDFNTKTAYLPNTEFPPIPHAPTLDDARAALRTVLEPIHMFPWRRIDGRSPFLSAYISLLLTLMLVNTIEGELPGFVISANVRGTGKSKLAKIASIVATGSIVQTTPFSESDDEVRKAILALLAQNQPLILFDNVTRKVSGDSIDILLTTRKYGDRVLGGSQMVHYPNDSIAVWTGNNIEAEGDTVRRVIPVEIEWCGETPPELRQFDFDPIKIALNNRPQIVSALLTMIRGWYVAGCPRDRSALLGSYEEWSSIVPQILLWLDVSNPLAARDHSSVVMDRALIRAANLANVWERAERALGAKEGITVGQIVRLAYPNKAEGDTVYRETTEIRHALEDLLGETSRDRVTRELGVRLRSANKRVAAGKMLVCVGQTHSVNRWSVRRNES